ncbi:MAG: hypothetical protein AAGF01_02625 [Cyanobacteria bacterium P01_G01_bin.38]
MQFSPHQTPVSMPAKKRLPKRRTALLVTVLLATAAGAGLGTALRFRLVEPTQQTRFSPQQNFPPIADWPLGAPVSDGQRSHVSGWQDNPQSQDDISEFPDNWESTDGEAETATVVNDEIEGTQYDWGESDRFVDGAWASDAVGERASMQTTIVEQVDSGDSSTDKPGTQNTSTDPYERLTGPAGDSMSAPLSKVTKSEGAVDSDWSSSTVESLDQVAPL